MRYNVNEVAVQQSRCSKIRLSLTEFVRGVLQSRVGIVAQAQSIAHPPIGQAELKLPPDRTDRGHVPRFIAYRPAWKKLERGTATLATGKA
jgi:hypothetical protein